MRKVLLYILVFCLTFVASAQDTLHTKKHRPKIGLVLSGGGAKGFAHIGVLKVLEEIGLEVDYIGGTSMGAIIGGLYSIGYSADAIERIVVKQNWNELLGDVIPRKYKSPGEKGMAEKYFVYFPVEKFKIKFPTGIQEGHNISKVFSKLTSPVYKENDFTKFQTPFVCIGADIMTGKSVAMKKGSLPQALRASMSIPSVFSPVEYNGHFMVDGGLINNFPVGEVKKMGADIIIGVDVQNIPYKKEDITSIFKVIDQLSFLYRKEMGNINKDLTDIYIHPDITGYSVGSFNNADSLISRGEKGARKMYSQIKHLSDSLNSIEYKPMKRRVLEPLDSVYVNDIKIENNKNIDKEFILNSINFSPNSNVSIKQIGKSLDKIYGTGFFTKLIYYFEYDKVTDVNTLVIKVYEAKLSQLGVGISYDSDFKSAFNLNSTVRNLFFDNSKLTTDVSFGESPAFYLDYFVNRGYRPSLGFRASSELYKVIVQDENINLLMQISTIRSGLYLKSHIKGLSIETGGEIEWQGISSNIGFLDFERKYYAYSNSYFRMYVDRLNRHEFPTKGFKLNMYAKYIHPLGKNSEETENPGGIARIDFERALKMTDRLTFLRKFHVGYTIGDSIPQTNSFMYSYYQINAFPGSVPFVGVKYMSQLGKYSAVVHGALQYELVKDNYLTLKADFGKLSSEFKDLTNFTKDFTIGYGLSYGARTFIGPVEFTIMSNNNEKGTMFYYLRIGRRLQ